MLNELPHVAGSIIVSKRRRSLYWQRIYLGLVLVYIPPLWAEGSAN